MSINETDVERDVAAESRRAARDDLENREPEFLERDIDATRDDLRATLSALERRFSVDRLVDMTIGRIRDRGGEFAGNLGDAAARNPIPLLLTSVGVAWLMMSRRDGGGRSSWRADGTDAAGKVTAAAEGVGERVRDAYESSRETLTNATDSLRSQAETLQWRASRAASATREQVEHAHERMDRLLHEQPLIIGALGLAAGAIIGALVPATETEQHLLGDVRDKAVKKVAESSRQRYEAARDDAAAHAAREDDSEQRPSRPH
jgi:hypothetical protein